MSKRIVVIVSMFLLGLRPSLSRGGVTSEVVKEGVKFIIQKFAREVAEDFGEDAAERLGERLAGMAAKYGEAESVSAVEKVGPRLFQVVAELGEDGAPKIIKLVNRCGDDAGYIVARPRSVAIFLKFGDPAADAMLKHKEIAEELIEQFGRPAATALNAIDGRNARRLAIVAEDGTFADLPQTPTLLNLIGKYGNPAAEWVWNNRAALGTGGLLQNFNADPERFLNNADPRSSGADGRTAMTNVARIDPEGVTGTRRLPRYALIASVIVTLAACLVVKRAIVRSRGRQTDLHVQRTNR